MAEVTDELLMAYADADDALSPLQRAKVEAFLQAHPSARRRIEIFRATGAPLSRLYGRPMAEPVPAHLKDFVLNYPLEAEGPGNHRIGEWCGSHGSLKPRCRTDPATANVSPPAAQRRHE